MLAFDLTLNGCSVLPGAVVMTADWRTRMFRGIKLDGMSLGLRFGFAEHSIKRQVIMGCA